MKRDLPVFVGDDAPFHLLVVLANANSQPGAQLAIIQGVHHAENLALVEAQAVGRFLLVLKVCPDVEGVADVRLHDPPIHWPGKSSGSEGAAFHCWLYMVFNETCPFPTLTILFLLGQNRHFFTLGEVQEEKHRLLSDDVRKIYIIYLQRGDTGVSNFSGRIPLPSLLSATETVNLYLD